MKGTHKPVSFSIKLGWLKSSVAVNIKPESLFIYKSRIKSFIRLTNGSNIFMHITQENVV